MVIPAPLHTGHVIQRWQSDSGVTTSTGESLFMPKQFSHAHYDVMLSCSIYIIHCVRTPKEIVIIQQNRGTFQHLSEILDIQTTEQISKKRQF